MKTLNRIQEKEHVCASGMRFSQQFLRVQVVLILESWPFLGSPATPRPNTVNSG